MNAQLGTSTFDSTEIGDDERAAKAFVSELIATTPDDQTFNVDSILRQHPELRQFDSLITDLAYEEYCREIEAGRHVDPNEFVARFPEQQESLLRVLNVHDFFDGTEQLVPAAPRWPKPGDEFLGFILIEELGRGAFSHVFDAIEPAVGDRRVVVKVCTHGADEANTLGQLEHPHVVPVFSVQHDEAAGLTAICMPFRGRATLLDVLQHAFRGPACPHRGKSVVEAIRKVVRDGDALEEPGGRTNVALRGLERSSYITAILRIAVQLADALAYTHACEVLHCDVKPSNVLLTADGDAMLIDFNLAAGQRGGRNVGGTLPYMAPEQLRAVVKKDVDCEFDERTDVFSCGIVIYELLSGQLPFGAIPLSPSKPEVAAQLSQRQSLGPRSLRALNPHVNRSCERLLERCLAFDPADRPQTAAALAKALRRELAPARRTGRWVFANRRAVSAVLLVLALSLAAFGIYWATSDSYADRQARMGDQAFQQHEFDRAIPIYTRALNSEPDHLDALLGRGESYLYSRQYDAAVQDFRRAFELSPQTPRVRAGMANSLFNRGRQQMAAERFDDAKQDLEEATEFSPSDPRILACLGFCKARQAKQNMDGGKKRMDRVTLSNAIWDFDNVVKWLEREPCEGISIAAVYNNLGYCHLKQHVYPEAESALLESIRRDNELRPAYLNLAEVDYQLAYATTRLPRTELIDHVRRLGPPTLDSAYLSALIFVLCANRTSSEDETTFTKYLERAIEDCKEAVAAGLSIDQLEKVAQLCDSLRSDPRFQAIFQGSSKKNSMPQDVRLVDPISTDDDPIILIAQ